MQIIDLRSDTVTRPSAGMRKAMFEAPLGDDVFGDDPTINALQEKVAAYFGKEAALFFPSGTMANQVAIKTHTSPGDEVICDQTSHVYRYEGGGIAANSGVSVRLLNGERGIFSGEEILANINADDAHFPKTKLMVVENTVNKGGGACWPQQGVSEVCDVSHKAGLQTHLDGARLWNALVKTNQSPLFYGEKFDTISVCFSKGLGCPVGSVLVGNKEFMYHAHRHRKRMGGGMRQAGILAAACIYAMDHNIERMAQDHAHAEKIGNVLESLSWVESVLPVETNIIYFKLRNAEVASTLLNRLHEKNIMANAPGAGWVRFVFHLDITEEMVSNLERELQQIKL